MSRHHFQPQLIVPLPASFGDSDATLVCNFITMAAFALQRICTCVARAMLSDNEATNSSNSRGCKRPIRPPDMPAAVVLQYTQLKSESQEHLAKTARSSMCASCGGLMMSTKKAAESSMRTPSDAAQCCGLYHTKSGSIQRDPCGPPAANDGNQPAAKTSG